MLRRWPAVRTILRLSPRCHGRAADYFHLRQAEPPFYRECPSRRREPSDISSQDRSNTTTRKRVGRRNGPDLSLVRDRGTKCVSATLPQIFLERQIAVLAPTPHQLCPFRESNRQAVRRAVLRVGYRASLSNLLSIRLSVFQLFEIVGVVDLENENPALPVGFAVDQARVSFERLVYLDNCSFDWGVNVAGG